MACFGRRVSRRYRRNFCSGLPAYAGYHDGTASQAFSGRHHRPAGKPTKHRDGRKIMRLDDEAESRNVDDRRGAGGGGGGGFRIGGGRSIGIGTIVVALAAAYFFGIDPMLILSGGSTGQSGSQSGSYSQPQTQQRQMDPRAQPQASANDRDAVFVRRVLGNTERTWQQIFRTRYNQDYPAPKLVLFTGGTATACGTGQSAMGPFYCPNGTSICRSIGSCATASVRAEILRRRT